MYLALADPCDHCVNETKLRDKGSSLRINFVLETRDQTQPGSLSLSHSAGTGRIEPWGQGWARTFLNNEGVSNFAEMEDYNVEAKWTMAE